MHAARRQYTAADSNKSLCHEIVIWVYRGTNRPWHSQSVANIYAKESRAQPTKRQLIHFTLKLAIVFVVIGLFYCAVCFFNFPNFFSACLADHLWCDWNVTYSDWPSVSVHTHWSIVQKRKFEDGYFYAVGPFLLYSWTTGNDWNENIRKKLPKAEFLNS